MTTQKNKGNRLSIQLSLDGFSFLVFAPHKLKIRKEKEVQNTEIQPFHDWLKVKLSAEELFRKSYTKTQILYTPNKITVVPTELVQDDTIREVFQLAHPLENNEIVVPENIGAYTFLYAIPEDIYNLMKNYFPKAEWTSAPTFLLKKLKNTKKWNVAVLVLQKRIYIVCTKNEELMFSNSFAFQTKDDLLYYMLYVFDHFDIQVAESSVQLWGNQDYLELLAEKLERYHDTVQVARKAYGTATKSTFGNLLLSNI